MNTRRWEVCSYYGNKVICYVEITGINGQRKYLYFYKKNGKVVHFSFRDYLNDIPFNIAEKLNKENVIPNY